MPFLLCQKKIKIASASSSKKGIKTTDLYLMVIKYLVKIGSIFESEMYSGSKYMIHYLYYEVMSLLFIRNITDISQLVLDPSVQLKQLFVLIHIILL
jgi:hypothetical protein